jgi:hypothetical protein
MKVTFPSVLCLAASLFAGAAWGQTPQAKPATLPSLPDEKGVASCPDGSSLTMGELRALIGDQDQQNQQAWINAMQTHLDQLCLARGLQKMALEDKLEQTSPVRERLMMSRTEILATAEINRLSNPSNIDGSELEAFYKTNKAKYMQFKLYAIYIGFTLSDAPQPAGEPKVLSKAEARAKITKLLDQIHAGADFKKLASENTDLDAAREKSGYFATLSPADAGVPDVVRNAIFKLQQGEVTAVIEQPAGFYIFKADEVNVKPFSEVRDQVYTELKQQRLYTTMEDLRAKNKAQIIPELLKDDDPKK